MAALRYTPDPEALAVVLAGRVDDLERRLRGLASQLGEVSTDVTALGRGVGELAGQVRRIATGPLSGGSGAAAAVVRNAGRNGAGTSRAGAGGAGDGDEPQEQRDWFAVADPDVACSWITDLLPWTASVLHAEHGHRLALAAPCWPLHGEVVAELLALQAEHRAAYTGARPTAISEWLARWLPTARDRIDAALTPCVNERGHRDQGRLYDAASLDPLTAAAWWAADRSTPAPRALALPAL